MMFWIQRTSDFRGEKQPHARAVKHGDGWAVDVADLADLLALAGEERILLLTYSAEMPTIEMYDDYRE